ncbi:hypothetical protein [Streptosporangium carneum]|uniref:Uncharacterized protein n=1 Tax=Streptosporangium carneum TaxID=47481 RepID=A0A9W6I2F8_9ACTN|nr:hypothetical protein [Streptosporangium carneum]GLK10800.1 hypothetical protein GCM10017600_42060 [Streptosporangium carneum]
MTDRARTRQTADFPARGRGAVGAPLHPVPGFAMASCPTVRPAVAPERAAVPGGGSARTAPAAPPGPAAAPARRPRPTGREVRVADRGCLAILAGTHRLEFEDVTPVGPAPRLVATRPARPVKEL